MRRSLHASRFVFGYFTFACFAAFRENRGEGPPSLTNPAFRIMESSKRKLKMNRGLLKMDPSKRVQKEISDIVSRLKNVYKPERIMLFGSWARGDFSEQSDVDFLLVKRTKRRPLWRRVDVRKIAGTDIPMDVVVYTPREFEELQESGSAFFREILKEGKILYEKE